MQSLGAALREDGLQGAGGDAIATMRRARLADTLLALAEGLR
jgi:hypothetical protein